MPICYKIFSPTTKDKYQLLKTIELVISDCSKVVSELMSGSISFFVFFSFSFLGRGERKRKLPKKLILRVKVCIQESPLFYINECE